MSLGAGETTVMRMTAGYAMLVNGGKRIRPTLIDRIQDRWGATIFKHDQRTCESRSLSDGNGVDIVAVDCCLPQRLLDDWDDGRHMTSRRELGHDSTMAFMQFELRGYD